MVIVLVESIFVLYMVCIVYFLFMILFMGICIIKIGWKVVCENREYGVIMLSFMMVLIMFIGIVYCMC